MMAWTPEEAEQVQGILSQFNGAPEVCAIMGCDVADLDALCEQAFGMSFERAKETFAAQGRALVRKAIFAAAMEGNTKALDMLAREQLGMGAVEIRNRDKQQEAKEGERVGNGRLSVLQGKRKDRRTRATG